MTNELDIDRLHAVLEGRINASVRATGKTTAMLYQLLGIVQVGGAYAEVIVVTHTNTWARELSRMFSDFLVNEHIKHNMMTPTEIHIVQSGQRFIFVTGDDVLLNQRYMGIRLYNYFFDMPDAYEAAYSKKLSAVLDSKLIFTGE